MNWFFRKTKRSPDIAGVIFGQAIGDALGSQNEFNKTIVVRDLKNTWGYDFPAYSDDTQMMLAVARAMIESPVHQVSDIKDFMEALSKSFVGWSNGDFGANNRSPGGTCLAGVRRLENSKHAGAWKTSGAVASGKGNGGVMRASVLGAIPDPLLAFRVAAMSSVPTHNNVESLLASGSLAFLISSLLAGESWHSSMNQLMLVLSCWKQNLLTFTACDDQYPEWAIGTIAASYFAALDKMPPEDFHAQNTQKYKNGVIGNDFKTIEALCQGIYSANRWNSYPEVVLNCANNSGDSDTTSAIAGALAGARWGKNDIPLRWVERIENAKGLNTYAQKIMQTYQPSK